MALTACKECSTEISTTAKACPKCGAKVPRTKWWLWGPLGLVAGVLMLLSAIGNSPDVKERGQARRAIDLCRNELAKLKPYSGEANLARGACEMMEDNFRKRFGANP